ncbi:unnamed protein product [Closterium sp. NIES-54]
MLQGALIPLVIVTTGLNALELETFEMELLELVVLQALALKTLQLETLELEALALGVLPASPLPAPSTYIEQTGGLTERLKPVSRSASPVHAVCTGCRVPRPRPPPVPGTHNMALRPSCVPSALSSSRTVPRLLATVVIDPSFESAAASALVAELVDFAAACHLDNAASLVADSDCPPSVGGECALGKDVLEDRQEEFECFAAAVPHLVSMLIALEGDPDAPDIPTPRSYAEAITVPYSSWWQTAMDAEMAS